MSLKLERPLSISLVEPTALKSNSPPGPVCCKQKYDEILRCQISQHNVFKLTVMATRTAALSNIFLQAEKTTAAFLA